MAGGGDMQAQIAEMAGKMAEGMVKAQEAKVDDLMSKLDQLDEDGIERLREARRKRLIEDQKKMIALRAQGHGAYMEIADQKQFFEEIKVAPTAVVHFYRSSTMRCEIVDMHMQRCARKYPECRFVKVNAEKAPFVCERLNIWALPSILLCNKGVTQHVCVGFNDFGDRDDFTENLFEYVLGSVHSMFKFKGETPAEFDMDIGKIKRKRYITRAEREAESESTDMSD